MRTLERARGILSRLAAPGSAAYWEARYQGGGDSGWGSAGALAEYKAAYLNAYVEANGIASVLEFGSGDGRQLALARYPRYIGVDVSRTAVDLCRRRFAADRTKSFEVAPYTGGAADLCLSLDVIYHLVEDRTFARYMRQLFDSASRAVIIYSSNAELATELHVRHRRFTPWTDAYAPGWRLTHVQNPVAHGWPDARLRPDFWVYERP